MNIKKLIKTAVTIMALAGLTSCGNLLADKNYSDKTNVTFGFADSNARTVNASYTNSNLTDIKISYKKSGDTEETVLVSGKSYSDLTNGKYKAEINPGTYSFYATAKVAEMNLSGAVENKEISSTQNSVTFSLGVSSYGTASGTGYINIGFNLNDANVTAVKGTLYNYSDGSIKIEEKALTIDASDSAARTFAYKVCEGSSIGESIEAGTYRLILDFYAGTSGSTKIGYYSEIINVSDGLTSSASRTLSDVGTARVITVDLNGGALANGVTIPEVVTKNSSAVTLPVKTQVTKAGYKFVKWIDASDTTETAITTIAPTGSNITVKAVWQKITYKIDWNKEELIDFVGTKYTLWDFVKNMGYGHVVIGNYEQYKDFVTSHDDSGYRTDFEKIHFGETENDEVYLYFAFDFATGECWLYILADGPVVFEDDDRLSDEEGPFANATVDDLKFENIDTSNMTNMKGMFQGLTFWPSGTLDISNLNVENVKDMSNMFKDCSKLKTIYVKDGTDFASNSAIVNSTDMFDGCTMLVGEKGTVYTAEKKDKSYARVDATGTPGYFTVTGHDPYVVVESVSIDSTLSLGINGTKLLTATVLPANANNKTITWTSSDTSIATVTDAGLITAVASGSATITATSHNGKTAVCTVTVTTPADFSFTLAPGSDINVTRAENVLTADEGYTDYTWYVDTVKKTRATTNTFDLDVAGLTKSGTYHITVEAKKNGEVYSSSMFVKYVAVLPEGFVKVTGGLITGSDDNQCWTSDYRGAFVADRKVKLSNFIICDHEVTKAEYKAIMNDSTLNTAGITADPSCTTNQPTKNVIADDEVDEKRPVEYVSWYDAVYYCNLLSQKKGLDCVYEITDITTSESTISNAGTSGTETVTIKYISSATVTADHTKNGYRLLTEAEWEYAARGGNPSAEAWKYEYAGADSTKTSVPYTTDDVLDSVGWYKNNSNNTGTTTSSAASEGTKGYSSHQVKLKSGNALGIYDMSGNVWEWCWDWHNDSVTSNDSAYTQYGKVVDPIGAASGSKRVIRGGCWSNDPRSTSVGHRSPKNPGSPGGGTGFRICRTYN